MMAFSNSFVVAVKDHTGKVLRETTDDLGRRGVFIPFHTNYSILLKNLNDRDCVASIKIDGTQVLGTDTLVIKAKDEATLERFMIDGDTKKGSKFLFVPISDGRVQDPSENKNGLIEVSFTLEKEKPKEIHHHHHHNHYPPYIPPYDPWKPNITWGSNIGGSSSYFGNVRSIKKGLQSSSDLNSMEFCETSSITSNSSADMSSTLCSADTRGATVEGGLSNQSFRHAFIGELETNSTTISLQIHPSKESLTVDKSRKVTRLEKKRNDEDKKAKVDALLKEHPELAEKLIDILGD